MQAQVKRRNVFGLTTGGLLAGGGLGFAHADAGGATGASGGGTAGTSNSPGVLSGNTVQVPVDAPVNACGDTVNVVGLKNVASGNHCANDSSGSTGATAHGGTSGSPGIISGNNVQLPIDVPVNLCGDTVNVVGLL